MGDQLEKYVSQHREAFDEETPDERLWKDINKELRSGKSYLIAWKVAAILLLVSTVYLLVDRRITPIRQQAENLDELAEFKEVEQFYTLLIQEKKNEIAKYDQMILKEEFLLEIDKLNESYGELKSAYAKQNASPMLVDAMISNLRIRMNILNQQLVILEKLKEAQNENEPISTI